MKTISIVLLLVFGFMYSGTAQQISKADNIRKLLELTGSGKMGKQIGESLIAKFRETYTEVPSIVWDDFLKEMSSDKLIEMVVPIYEKYFTDEDINQMISFYGSPLGKKLIATMPPLMQECIQAGQNWGKECMEKTINKLKEEGYIKKDS